MYIKEILQQLLNGDKISSILHEKIFNCQMSTIKTSPHIYNINQIYDENVSNLKRVN